MSGLALILAAAVGVQDIAQPVAAPRLTAVLSQPAGPSLISDVERLAADGVPGAAAMHRAFVALISGGSGPNWAGACPIWEAASTTSAEAAHFTAECVENGHDRPADLERAAELYRLAGDGGFPKSLCALGNMYMAGRGVPRDPSRAAELCLRGAEMGDADAQTDLGTFYLDGDGIAQDYAEARRWYEQAALKQQRNALFTLGVMAWNGLGGEPDLEAAGRWFEGAYAAGRRDAASFVGGAALLRAAPNAPSGPVDPALLATAKAWFEIALVEDPDESRRAQAGVALAQISGYEAMIRQETGAD